jgi:hypothetical protein
MRRTHSRALVKVASTRCAASRVLCDALGKSWNEFVHMSVHSSSEIHLCGRTQARSPTFGGNQESNRPQRGACPSNIVACLWLRPRISTSRSTPVAVRASGSMCVPVASLANLGAVRCARARAALGSAPLGRSDRTRRTCCAASSRRGTAAAPGRGTRTDRHRLCACASTAFSAEEWRHAMIRDRSSATVSADSMYFNVSLAAT